MKPREHFQCVAVMLRVWDVTVMLAIYMAKPLYVWSECKERNMTEIMRIIQGCPDALAEVEFRVKRQHGDNWLEPPSPRASSLNLSTRFQRQQTHEDLQTKPMAFHLLTPLPVESDSSQGHTDGAVYILAASLGAKLCCSGLSLLDVEELCLWEQQVVNSKSSLMWGANSCMSHLFLL